MNRVEVVVCILLAFYYPNHASISIRATFSPEVSGVETLYSESGTMGFRILKREDQSLLIGGKEKLLAVNHKNPAQPHIVQFQTCENGNSFFQCRDQTVFQEDRDCFNFIRIAEDLSSNSLLVCGTNALNPRCYVCNVTRTGTEIQSISCPGPKSSDSRCVFTSAEGLGTIDGSKVAPKHWELNATAIFDLESHDLFLGVSNSNDKAQTTVARVTVNVAGTDGSDTEFTHLLETTSYFQRSVNEADFVGKPLLVGDRAYFFYREIAVEHISEGNVVYSRVARVCKADSGIGMFYWSSFQKARLNCSIPSAFPVYYNDIQDIFVEERDSEYYIHTVFASLANGPQSSAVCVYRLSDINTIFDEGRFKGPPSPESIWLTKPNSEVPDPRPGLNCSNPTTDRQFVEQFPLMQQLVENYDVHNDIPQSSDAPVFYMDDVRFSAILQDKYQDKDIYYIATESGSVLKVYRKGTGELRAYEFKITENNQPLVGIHLSNDGEERHLVAVSDNTVYKLPLENCATSCRKKCAELLFGYCEWEGGCCRRKKDNSTCAVTNCPDSACDVHVTLVQKDSITSCDNQKVQLYCQAQTSPLCPDVGLAWTRDGGKPLQGLGHLISLDPLYDHDTNRLHLLTVHPALAFNATGGVAMECTATMETDGKTHSVTKTTKIHNHNCITKEGILNRHARHMQLQDANKETKKHCGSGYNGPYTEFDCANCARFP